MDENQQLFIKTPTLVDVTRISEKSEFPLMIRESLDHMQVLYVKEGRCSGRVGSMSYPLKSGDCFIVDPSTKVQLHVFDMYPFNGILLSCEFQLAGKPPGYLKVDLERPVISFSINQQIIEAYLETICREKENYSIGSQEMIAGIIQALLIMIIRRWEQPLQTDVSSISQQVQGYIKANFDKELTLSELARLVHVSPHHLAHVFKDETGMAPIRYLIQCRVEEAKKLLHSSDLKVHEISDRVGYPNTTHFNQIFKKIAGISPGEYRKMRDARKG